MTELKVPFRQGMLQHFPYPTPDEWRDNCEFEAELTYQGFTRGRSAAYGEFIDRKTGQEFPMFLVDLNTLLKEKTIHKGTVKAVWTFCKRGKNYGIRLAEPARTKAKAARGRASEKVGTDKDCG